MYSYSSPKEYSFDYPKQGVGNNQYVGNAFNLRQLSLKLRLRVVPVPDLNWSSVNSGNYISYRVLLISPKSIADIQDNPIASGYPFADDMFQDIPPEWDFHTPFTFPGNIDHSHSVAHAPPFLLQHPVWQQSFIDRYYIHQDYVSSINLNQAQSFIHVVFKSDRHIIQDLSYWDPEEETNKNALFPWFRVILIPIFFSGLARSLIYSLSPETDQLPLNFFSVEQDIDLYYTDN
jgi:hypothetical protein